MEGMLAIAIILALSTIAYDICVLRRGVEGVVKELREISEALREAQRWGED
ncbi:MAG: hypothetical protein AAF581_11080 [Planctomycetota bacterium]